MASVATAPSRCSRRHSASKACASPRRFATCVSASVETSSDSWRSSSSSACTFACIWSARCCSLCSRCCVRLTTACTAWLSSTISRTSPARLSSESAPAMASACLRTCVLEAPGVFAEVAQLGEHALDQFAQRGARAVAFVAQFGVARARMRQHLAGLTHIAHADAAGQLGLQQLALAARPAVVLGEFAHALRQLGAQPAELVDQALAMREHAPRALAQLVDLAHQFGAGAVAAQPLPGLLQRLGQLGGVRFGRAQRGAQRRLQLLRQRQPVRRRGRGRGARGARFFRRRVGARVRRFRRPRLQQRAHALLQPLCVVAAAASSTRCRLSFLRAAVH